MAQESPAIHKPGDRLVQESARVTARDLAAGLSEMGLSIALGQSAWGTTAGGADIQVRARKLCASDAARQRLLRRIAALTAEGIPLTVCLRDLGSGDRGIAVLEDFCRSVRRYLAGDEGLLGRIGLCLHPQQIPLQGFMLISRCLLGNGPRYVILDSLQMRHHLEPRVQEETESIWSFLWRQQQAEAALMPAYGPAVRSGCPLLGDEAAEVVQPPLGLHGPAGSAWLPVGLYLPRYADDEGQIDWQYLEGALEAAVDLGNRLLDVLSWPTADQRCDAWLNRRLAVSIGGIGDLVAKSGHDAGSLDCLTWLHETMRRVRRCLWTSSQAIARRSEVLPALARSDLSGGLIDSTCRRSWQRRWRQALSTSVVMNRNLLVMSPYSVLPTGTAAAREYIDLLPVLEHADAYAFAGGARPGGWNVVDFRNLHTRAWAVMQHRHSRSLVAVGV